MPAFPPVRSNIKPDKANANHHSFQMYTFDKTTNCRACRMFLRWGLPALAPPVPHVLVPKGACCYSCPVSPITTDHPPPAALG